VTRRVSPGTRLREVADVLVQVTSASGRGATVAEIRGVYHRQYGRLDPTGIDRALRRLEAAGIIRKIGGRHRRTQWAHADHPVRFVDAEDPAPMIVEIVAALCRRLGRPVETREVAAELVRRGVEGLSNDQVRTRLESLAHGSDRKSRRTVGVWSEPMVRRIAGTTGGGRRHVTWAPLDQELDEHGFRDMRDAIRYAVERVAGELGRPASRREILLWARALLASDHVEAPDGHSLNERAARVVCSPSFRTALAGTAAWDAVREGGDARIRTVRTPLSSRGAYPVRFAAGTGPECEEAACLVEDLATLLRPRTEVEGIERLRREAEEVGSDLLMEIAATREEALRAAFARSAPALRGDLVRLVEVCGLVVHAREMVSDWARRGGARRGPDLVADAEVVGFLALQCPSAAGRPREAVRGVDQVQGVRITKIEDLAREALDIGDRDVRYWSPLIAGARRLRGPVRGGNSAEDPMDTESFLDRPDVLRAIASATYLPTLSSLLGMASDILGGVIRDPTAVRQWLERARPGDVELRQALTVALGMLGEPAPVGLAWPDPGDAGEAMAYLVSVALAVGDYERRVRLAEEAEMRAEGAAVEVTERALGRVESGCRLGVVD